MARASSCCSGSRGRDCSDYPLAYALGVIWIRSVDHSHIDLSPMATALMPSLPDDQPVAVNALRHKRSALMAELALHQQECDRICSEIIHLDVVLRMFDP